MPDEKISGLTVATSIDGSEFMEIIQGGINKQLSLLFFINNYRGDWAGTSAFPATGGTLGGGVPRAGDRWRLTGTLSIGGNIYAPGTIIEAAINTPGQTLANWNKYAMQL